MNQAVDSTHPDFWSSRYDTGKMPWDFGGVPAAVKSFLSRSSGPDRVLIPGCGSGYEVQPFHDAGYDVTAIDFSPAAVARATRVLGDLAKRVMLGNFFTRDFGPHRFDLIYERTFLCSLPPSRWPEYVSRMAALLSPGGRLVSIFLYGQEREPPPYPLRDNQAELLFQTHLRLVRSDLVTDSLPLFRGMERWQEWIKQQDDAACGG